MLYAILKQTFVHDSSFFLLMERGKKDISLLVVMSRIL